MAVTPEELAGLQRERGIAVGSVLDELYAEIPELTWPHSIEIFRQMLRSDGQLAGVWKAIKLPLQATPWYIEPGQASEPVARATAEALGLAIVGESEETARPRRLRGRFSWKQHIEWALKYLTYGHMVFEQVYELAGNRLIIRKLAPRWPWTIRDFDVADDGGLNFIEQYGRDGQPIQLNIDRLVVYVNEREGGNWQGQSILRPAYKHWIIKDRFYRLASMTGERAMGVPTYEGSENATQVELDEGERLAEEMRTGERAGVAVPHGAKLRYMGIEGSLFDPLPHIEHHSKMEARSVLEMFMNLETGELGSRALGESFLNFYMLSLQAVLEDMQIIAQQHVIEDFIDINFGTGEAAPLLVPGDVAGQPATIAAAVIDLIKAGGLEVDDKLESHLRRAYRLPQREAVE